MKREDCSFKVKYLLQYGEIHLEIVTIFAVIFQSYLKLCHFFPFFGVCVLSFTLFFSCYSHILVKRNRLEMLSNIFPVRSTIIKIEIMFYFLIAVFARIVTNSKRQ